MAGGLWNACPHNLGWGTVGNSVTLPTEVTKMNLGASFHTKASRPLVFYWEQSAFLAVESGRVTFGSTW